MYQQTLLIATGVLFLCMFLYGFTMVCIFIDSYVKQKIVSRTNTKKRYIRVREHEARLEFEYFKNNIRAEK